MKKIIVLLVMLLTLSGCSLTFLNKTDNTISDSKPDQPPVQSQEPEAPDSAVTPDAPDQKPDTLLPDPDKDDAAGEPNEPEQPKEADEEISISHTDVTLRAKGETFTLSEKNVPGVYACTFASEDPETASVDEMSGLVTAQAPGRTKITAHIECEKGQYDFQCIVRCAWKEEDDPSVPASGTADTRPALSDFFTTLQGNYEGLDAMMVIDGELMDTYYPGLKDIAAVEEVLLQETMLTMSNVAVGLVKLKADATLEDVIAVQNVLQDRITAQAEGGAWYPMSCETWKEGIITSVSNCVGMFVYPEDAQGMADQFTTAFSS